MVREAPGLQEVEVAVEETALQAPALEVRLPLEIWLPLALEVRLPLEVRWALKLEVRLPLEVRRAMALEVRLPLDRALLAAAAFGDEVVFCRGLWLSSS